MSPVGTIVLAGGGTGGHLYPGLAIAERARDLADIDVLCLCSDRAIDEKILSSEHQERVVLPAKTFGVRPRTLLRFLRAWGPSLRSARRVLRERRSRGPVVVVSLGGFVAAPAARAAVTEHVPIVLANLDAVPGRANRWIASMARHRLSTIPVAGRSWRVVGPIVRRRALSSGDARADRAALGLDPDLPVLFITGASQGAGSINAAMVELCARQPALFSGWQVLHQAGEKDLDVLASAYVSAGVPARVVAYIDHMGRAWGAAELAIARAGAGTVGETWANRVPTVFMPYPYHADEHQRVNAQPLVDAGGGVVVRDAIDPLTNADALAPVLERLLGEPGERAAMRERLGALGPSDGAREVARVLVDELAGQEAP